jgi:hypothetical protein
MSKNKIAAVSATSIVPNLYSNNQKSKIEAVKYVNNGTKTNNGNDDDDNDDGDDVNDDEYDDDEEEEEDDDDEDDDDNDDNNDEEEVNKQIGRGADEDIVDDLVYDIYNLTGCNYHPLRIQSSTENEQEQIFSDETKRVTQLIYKR